MKYTPSQLAQLRDEAESLTVAIKAGQLNRCPACDREIIADHSVGSAWSVMCLCGWSMAAQGVTAAAPGKPN